MSNTHNWPFDNAWQEMLNHATNKVSYCRSLDVFRELMFEFLFRKVAEAEKKKAEAHAEHQRKALICNKAEFEVNPFKKNLNLELKFNL